MSTRQLRRILAAASAAAVVAGPAADAYAGIMLRNTDSTIVYGRTVEFGVKSIPAS